MNDNRINGAKNVLLLIVSGKEEITIDEIGLINDYIQEKAGHGANIIMGVGEDLNLENSISVTVIATGFNPNQQEEIINSDPKTMAFGGVATGSIKAQLAAIAIDAVSNSGSNPN